MAFAIGVACDRGVGAAGGGRDRNEDNYLIAANKQVRYRHGDRERTTPVDGEGALVAVLDGMGGHDDGHIASEAAAKILAKLFQPGTPPNPERALLRYVRDAHRTLHWKVAERGPVTMGTTVAVAWLLHGTASWVNVGDSRIYRYRLGDLELLTLDHTRNEFARRDGATFVPDGADHLAQSFIYGSRGMGDNSHLRLEPGLDSGTIALQPHDVLLLCTDGVWGALAPERIADLLHEHPEPQDAAHHLVQAALEAGATDNLTALVVRMVEDAPPHVEWTDNFDALRTL